MVEQKLDALARSQLAALVLRVDARLPAAQPGVLAAQFEGFEDVFHGAAPSGQVCSGVVCPCLARRKAGLNATEGGGGGGER